MAATMGCGGQSSHAHVPRRGPGGLAGYSVFRPGRGLAGKLLNCRSPRVCNVFRFAAQSITGSIPVGPRGRRHPLHPQRPRRQDAGRGRTAAAFGSIRLGLSVLSARARRTRCYPWRRVRRVQRSCLWDVWAAFCAVQGGVGNAPRRGCSQPPSVSCAFSMPPARSIGRPAPAGLAACGSGSGLAAGAQAGVGMLMSSPAYGSSGRGVSVASS